MFLHSIDFTPFKSLLQPTIVTLHEKFASSVHTLVFALVFFCSIQLNCRTVPYDYAPTCCHATGGGGGGILPYSLDGGVPLGSRKSYPLVDQVLEIL